MADYFTEGKPGWFIPKRNHKFVSRVTKLNNSINVKKLRNYMNDKKGDWLIFEEIEPLEVADR